MRKVVLMMHMSLDGFVGRANGDLDWIFPDMDEDLQQWTFDTLRPMDTQLIGGGNYQEQSQYLPAAGGGLAPPLNRATKNGFSTTPETVEWRHSRPSTTAAATEVKLLKEQPGNDIYVPGGARFAQSLSRLGLIDEYRLVVHPVALGTGLPLFADPVSLRLVTSRQFATGAVAFTYQRA